MKSTTSRPPAREDNITGYAKSEVTVLFGILLLLRWLVALLAIIALMVLVMKTVALCKLSVLLVALQM